MMADHSGRSRSKFSDVTESQPDVAPCTGAHSDFLMVMPIDIKLLRSIKPRTANREL